MIRFEPNFRLRVLHHEMAIVLHHASIWSEVNRVGLVVNHGNEGVHKNGSLHPWDLALDLDTEGDRFSDTEQLYAYLARILPGAYDVLLERDHVHVEFDPHRRPPALEPAAATPAAPRA